MNASTRRITILVAFLVAVAAGAVVGLVFISRAKPTQSATAVLQHARTARLAELASLGPNTTLHGMSTDFSPGAGGLPDTTIGESFWTFDAAGKLSAYSSVVRGTDGHAYQRSDLVNGALVDTNLATGVTHTTPGYSITAASLRAVQSRVISATLAGIPPSALATTTQVNGVAVFVIDSSDGHGGTNRDYVRQTDYWPVRMQHLAPDGRTTTSDTTQTTLEVLSNGPTIAAGAPSLIGGTVNLPIMLTGAVPNAYRGVNVHLRWSPAVFSFSTISTTGSILPPAMCPWSATADADGGGVMLRCTSTGAANLTATGLLVSVALTPKTGCSALHLATLAGADNGNATTGTYTLNATDAHPQYNPYVDGRVSATGRPC